jgi:hypothetical protein
MAYSIQFDIRVGDFCFSRANGVTVRKSTSTIGATATIKMPMSAVIENKGERSGLVEVQHALKVGDPVSITLGYNDYKNEEFSGFVKNINPNNPLELECEDNNFLLRKKNINKSWKSTTLKEVLEEIVSGTDVKLSDDIPEMGLEPYYIKNKDGAWALQDIVEKYMMTAYFQKDGKLYAGLHYTQKTGEETLVLNGKDVNVISSDNLKFRKSDDVKIKIKAVWIKKDNSRVIEEAGDENGALRTFLADNISSKADLKDFANQQLKQLKFDGYEGNVKTFLIPFIEPGYTVNIKDSSFPDREGSYYVESTKVTAGDSGMRREIEISIKL